MKRIAIYAVCIFGYGAISALIKSTGIILGAVPTGILFFATFELARHLCNKYAPSESDNEDDTEWMIKDEGEDNKK